VNQGGREGKTNELVKKRRFAKVEKNKMRIDCWGKSLAVKQKS